ncbi:MAG: hypothetical protein ACAH21_14855 [Ramlibacter sp.]|nr:hypothetical protein [Ramlibacter sp.]
MKVVLRDSMRKHGVPSDWIECRILSATTRQRKSGLHVQFIVLKGEEQLLTYVHAFQDSFWRELERYDGKAREWLFSIGWQFMGKSKTDILSMPKFDGWDEDTLPPEPEPQPRPARQEVRDARHEQDAQDTQPPEDQAEQIESDLAALYAIRDAALSQPADLAELPPATPRPHKPGR